MGERRRAKNCRHADDVKMKEREEMITRKRKYGRGCVDRQARGEEIWMKDMQIGFNQNE